MRAWKGPATVRCRPFGVWECRSCDRAFSVFGRFRRLQWMWRRPSHSSGRAHRPRSLTEGAALVHRCWRWVAPGVAGACSRQMSVVVRARELRLAGVLHLSDDQIRPHPAQAGGALRDLASQRHSSPRQLRGDASMCHRDDQGGAHGSRRRRLPGRLGPNNPHTGTCFMASGTSDAGLAATP